MRRSLAIVVGLSLAAPAWAAKPAPSDWWLLDVTQDAASALVIDKSSVVDRRGGKQARVAVIYDANSEIAAIEMTLVVDCAAGREKARSVRLHDQAGHIFSQGVSGRFETAENSQPWRQYLCASGGISDALAPLGSEFPTDAARKMLNTPGSQALKQLGQPK